MTQPGQEVEDLFARAMDLDPSSWSAFLDQECPDAKVREFVEKLLKQDARDVGLSCAEHNLREPLGSRIGPYTLTATLGEGGMGYVYLAEQAAPLKREVALKLIKVGMDTEALLHRFEREREVIARMDHKNIARVFDAGAAPSGRPYYVMEYVAGEPITDSVDSQQLDLPSRVRLFIDVLAGVQHAHQKGIIHRDLKPTNILVAATGTTLEPKIIDFGISKVLHEKEGTESTHTVEGGVLGTPEYMSPEQAQSGATAVDTRSDIYSLGVVLYELLVGVTPHDSKELRAAGLSDLGNRLRTTVIRPPSLRLRRLDETHASVAQARGSTLKALRNQLRDELDWIVMRALDPDPQRRYGSPASLRQICSGSLIINPSVQGHQASSTCCGNSVNGDEP